MDKFVHLHTHSTYSFTDGFGLPNQYIDRAVALGQPGIGVTDHGNISAHYKWYKACKQASITPILGCEFYLVKNKNDIRERNYNHITVLVKNNVGYRNLTKLVTKAWCEQFYYKPRITWDDLFENQEGLIVLSGCLSSPIMEKLKSNDIQGAGEILYTFQNKLDDFYIEIQPIKFEKDDALESYKRLINLYQSELKQYGFKWVVTNDCHYVEERQAKVQEVLLCVQTNDSMNNPEHWKFDQEDFFLKTREQMESSLKECHPTTDFTDALDETVRIAESITFEFPMANPIKFPMKEEDKFGFLRAACYAGLKRIGQFDNKEYIDRVEYELDLIQKKNFMDYFLVISDLVNWAKDNKILVGPARGSAAGSLACYCLRITEVDPIPYGLLFERFIDINREDLPDIDVDFEDARRHEIKEYLQKKYGMDKVGNLPVFMQFKGKSALNDVGRVFSIPFKTIDEINALVIERSGGDSRASFTLMDTFENPVFTKPAEAMKQYPDLIYAVELEGQYRQMGQHAAGVVISNEPITNFCAIYKVKDELVLSMDYKDITDIGLLKIDLLGLSTLSVVSKALGYIKERHNKSIDIYTLPLNDKKVYKGFLSEKLFGIFQFDGQAVNQVCRQIKPEDFESLSAISALARPGPLNGGSTTAYIMRRSKREPVVYPHKLMKSYTEETYGVVVYQEQVMKTMREIGKMSWKDTSDIRKLISRSQGVEKFNTFKEKFSIGAKENGMSEQQIDVIWDAICTFGSWAFNKSHSVSYTVISYWTMWLKVYYPIEFYGAILAVTADEDKRKKILKEYKREGFKMLSPNINKSKETFAIEDEGLRIGFADIKGIGPMTAAKIVKHQPYVDFFTVQSNKITLKTVSLLSSVGALDEIEEASKVNTLFGAQEIPYDKPVLTFSERFAICPWDVDFAIEKDWMPFIAENSDYFKTPPIQIDKLKTMKTGFDMDEVCLMGIVYDKNLKDAREEAMSRGKNIDMTKFDIVKLLKEQNYLGGQYMSKYQFAAYKKKHPDKKAGVDYEHIQQFQFANFVLEDDSDFITVRLSHLKFPEYGRLIFEDLKPDDVVIVKGKMGSGIRMFFANKILSLRQFKAQQDAKTK